MKAMLLILIALFQFQAHADKKNSKARNNSQRNTVAYVAPEPGRRADDGAARMDQLDQHEIDFLPPNTVLQFLSPFVAEIKTDRSLLMERSGGYFCYAHFAPDTGKRRESREGITFQISSITKESGRSTKFVLQGTGFPAAITVIECTTHYDRFLIRELRELLSRNNAKLTLGPSSGF